MLQFGGISRGRIPRNKKHWSGAIESKCFGTKLFHFLPHPFINIHHFPRLQAQRNPRPEDGVFHLQGFQTSRPHSFDRSQRWGHFSHQLPDAGKWLGWYFPPDRHPAVNRMNADSALVSEPITVFSVFLEPFLNVTFRVHSLELSYRKGENKKCISIKFWKESQFVKGIRWLEKSRHLYKKHGYQRSCFNLF